MIINYFRKLIYLLGSEKKKLPLILLSFLFLSAMDLLGLGLIGPFITIVMNDNIDSRIIQLFDFFKLGTDKETILNFSSIVIISIFFFKALLIIFVNWYIIRFSQFQRVRLGNELLQMYQNISFLKFIDKNTSSYIYTVHTLTSNYVNAVKNTLKLISDLVVSLAVISVLLYTNFILIIFLSITFGALFYSYDLIFRNIVQLYGVQANNLGTKFLQNINESLLGLKEMRIFGFMDYFRLEAMQNCHKMNVINEKRQIILLLPRQITEFFLVAIIIIFVLYQFNSNPIKEIIPSLTIFGFAAIRIIPIINSISIGILNFRHDNDILKRLYTDYEYIKINSFIENNHNSKPSEFYFKSIELKDVSFNYNDKNIILNKINLKINKGDMVGIIGASGSGKTTLVDIITGLIKSTSGSIYINGISSSDIFTKLKNSIAYIPQDVFLIDNTIKANIAIGIKNNKINLHGLNKAIKMANLNDFVSKLPDGYNTLIGEKGSQISGGQKQRIALARAFYHEKDIIVLDESTSALDVKTEKMIIKSINNLKKLKTIIIITHRLSTIQNCNKIFNLKNKAIDEYKSYSDFTKKL